MAEGRFRNPFNTDTDKSFYYPLDYSDYSPG